MKYVNVWCFQFTQTSQCLLPETFYIKPNYHTSKNLSIFPPMKNKLKPVSHSQTILSELMTPNLANFGGKVHGGSLLSLMDKAAYVCATKHAGNYCVTVSVDGVDFHNPVEVGEQVSLYASVNYVGSTSLVVGIKVVAENVKLGSVRHTNSSFFTMVAMDENHKPAQVPGLILETKDQVRRFAQAKLRKQLKREKDQRFNELDKHDLSLLANENCEVQWAE
jgi:uncharacterized protein (TIGR00369 family)